MAGMHKKLIHISQDELTNLEGDSTTKCKYCGKSIWYDSTKVSFRNDGQLGYEVGGTTYRTSKYLNGIKYPILVCQHCLEKKYPDFKEKNKSKIFNTFNKYVVYAFEIPQDIIDEKNKLSVPTLENCIRKHGEEKGREVFEEYKRKQAYTNSFEYKQEKYGWTKEEYDDYNRSRAVTLENLIKKHGEEEGRVIWDNYCKRQSETSSNEYIISTFGNKRGKDILLLKARSIDGYINVYGEEKGRELYEQYITSTKDKKSYSKFSKKFFDELVKELQDKGFNFTYRYGDDEHWEWATDKKLYFFDFYIPELNFVIELNGDYWHCKPDKYSCDYIHELRHMTAKEIWEYDNHRNESISNDMGHNLEIIWESDVRNHKSDVIFNLVNKISELYVSKHKENKENK